jgi:hypothetical protein
VAPFGALRSPVYPLLEPEPFAWLTAALLRRVRGAARALCEPPVVPGPRPPNRRPARLRRWPPEHSTVGIIHKTLDSPAASSSPVAANVGRAEVTVATIRVIEVEGFPRKDRLAATSARHTPTSNLLCDSLP